MEDFKPMNWKKQENNKSLSKIAAENYVSPLGDYNWYQEKILRFGSSIWMVLFALLLVAQMVAQFYYLVVIGNEQMIYSTLEYMNLGVILGMLVSLFIVCCVVFLVVASITKNIKWVRKTLGGLYFITRLIVIFVIIGIVLVGLVTVLTALSSILNAIVILSMLVIQYFFLTRFFSSIITFIDEIDNNLLGKSIRMADPSPIRLYLWVYFVIGLLGFLLTLMELTMVRFYDTDLVTRTTLAVININAFLGVIVFGYTILLTHIFVKRCPNQPIPLES